MKTFANCVAAVAIAVFALGSPALAQDVGAPTTPASPQLPSAQAPIEPVAQTRGNTALLSIGIVSTLFSYGMAVGSAGIYGALVWPIYAGVTHDNSFSPTMAWLFVPLVGPILSAQTDSLNNEPRMRTMLYLDSAVQFAGVTAFVLGLVIRHPVSDGAPAKPAGPSVVFGPGPGGTPGLSLAMTFE
jgi:hypothetical protein